MLSQLADSNGVSIPNAAADSLSAYAGLVQDSLSSPAPASLTTVFDSLAAPTITYGTTSTILSGHIAVDSLIPPGSVSISLYGLTESAAIDSESGLFSAMFPTALLSPAASPYTITYAYAGDADFPSTTATTSLVVNQATPTITWPDPTAIVHGSPLGATQLDATASVPGTFAYTPSAGTVLDAGSDQTLAVTFTPNDTSDFNTASATATINVAKAPLTVSANDATTTYGAPVPTLNGSIVGIQNNDPITATYTTVGTASSPAGTYAITPVLSDPSNRLANYAVILDNGTLTVGKAPLTIMADDASKLYGEMNPAFTTQDSGFVLGQDAGSLAGTLSFSTSAQIGSPVGSDPVTPGGLTSTNYAILFIPGTLAITRAPLTIAADDQTKVYGAAIPLLTAEFNGFVNGDTPSSLATPVLLTTTATPFSHVGSYAITASGATSGNYAITFASGSLTVNPAPLTITADDKFTVSGMTLPIFTASTSGFVNGEGPGNLSSPVSLSTLATPAPPGSYPITASGAASPDYTIRFQNGTLTVTPAPTRATPPSNPITDPRVAFVTTLYNEILDRGTEPRGLQFWLGTLAAGISDARVARAIWDSPEHRNDLRAGGRPPIRLAQAFFDASRAERDILFGSAHPDGPPRVRGSRYTSRGHE